MASFVVKVLSITLGLFFIFVGLLKLSPSINKELYKEMRKQFIRMAKVFPLVTVTGWKPNSHIYRKVMAATEVTCGAILVLIPGPLKIVANVVMILVNANDIIAHTQIKDGLQRMSLPIVFILLLLCRLLIYYQETRREKKLLLEKQEAENQTKNSSPEQQTSEPDQQTSEQITPEEKKAQ